MNIHIRHRLFVRVGYDVILDRRGVLVCWGWRPDAPEDESAWRHTWRWCPPRPYIVFRAARFGKIKIVYPIGIKAFGRVWMWPDLSLLIVRFAVDSLRCRAHKERAAGTGRATHQGVSK
ncbi:MAG: hypothetical protein HXX10_07530 [Rhodoplanes sp.]|uniref:hypothetical protein n=1 Tax=Rhodoplanes sp. TaxID=1968906 RepID=UPI00180ACF0B|nr:hypothetical protein [Rhodoplanes sp.]NVO13871.1 hypothetical protein [Rhodoplanes sp.]